MSKLPRLAYSVAEVAEMMGVSTDSVYNAAKAGKLPTVDIAGDRVLIPAYRLDEHIAAIATGGLA